MLLFGEGTGRDAMGGIGRDQKAAPVSVRDDLADLLVIGAIQFVQRNGNGLGLHLFRNEGHFVIRPGRFRRALAPDPGVVIDQREATAVGQGGADLGTPAKATMFDLFLPHFPQAIAALNGANILSRQIRPFLETAGFPRHHIGATGIVRLDHPHHLAALRVVAKRRDDQVDPFLLREFHPVRGHDRRQFHRNAQKRDYILRKVDLQFYQFSIRIQIASGAIVVLDADHDLSSGEDLVQCVARGEETRIAAKVNFSRVFI
ncbi:MAG: hypothetical protein QM789_06465 [Paenirhodobacter sp.]